MAGSQETRDGFGNIQEGSACHAVVADDRCRDHWETSFPPFSVLPRTLKVLSDPPATRTMPFCSNVAVCNWRAMLSLLVAVQVPLAGSYSSTLAEAMLFLLVPPATRTMPFCSKVAA